VHMRHLDQCQERQQDHTHNRCSPKSQGLWAFICAETCHSMGQSACFSHTYMRV
jgi:hypothetical protein